jgi:hypothetical protein
MSIHRRAQFNLSKYGYGVVRAIFDWSGLIRAYTVNGKILNEYQFEEVLLKKIMLDHGITDREMLRNF